MSQNNLSAFFGKAAADSALQERVDALRAAKDTAALVALSQECGTPVTAEELNGAVDRELSEAELGGVSGGNNSVGYHSRPIKSV